MKYTSTIWIVALVLVSPSCSFLSNADAKKRAYKEGFVDGEANAVKRKYWADQTAPPPQLAATIPPVEARKVTVPEHTASDGVLIEAHQTEINIQSENP